jgi:4-carboxymuconolactone decarboxylase
MNTKSAPDNAQKSIGDIAPKLAAITDQVLFGDVWNRTELSPRERSLITCGALVVLGKTDQLSFHFPLAIKNGLTKEELVELVTHLAFYGGWPCAMSAAAKLREI